MMWTIAAALTSCVLGAAPPVGADRAVPFKTLFPYIGPSTIGVAHLDLAGGGLRALAKQLVGDDQDSPLAEASKKWTAWADALRVAGAKDLFIVLDLADFPVAPLAVVPLVEGADAKTIGQLLCGGGGGKARPPVHFPKCETIRGAVAAGPPEALEQARGAQPTAAPEVTEAFEAIDHRALAARLILLLSTDNRRIIEETVPNLPRELGGGPITDVTRGLKWVALGTIGGERPTFQLVVAASSAETGRKLQKLGRDLFEVVGRMPAVAAAVHDWDKLGAMFRVNMQNPTRITVTADAQAANRIIEALSRPARATASRSQCVNNLKQIGLALHNHAAAHKLTFPPAYTADKAGKPLLSWRVAILPYIEQDALYKEFHLDEAWDSPHNRALIERMPPAYRCPGAKPSDVRAGKTRYLAPRNKHSVLSGAEGVGLKAITDGTSNTILVIDAGDKNAVVWTRPDDWEVGEELKALPPDVFQAHGTPGATIGTNALFADGSVHFLRDTIKPDVLRKLLTRDGGEVVSADDL